MPPKKKRAAAQPVDHVQPKPQRPTRASSRKRRHSDTSNGSDVPSSQGDANTPSKRLKRGRPAKKEPIEAIAEEDEDAMTGVIAPTCEATGSQPDTDAPVNSDTNLEEEIHVSQSSAKHVHFSGSESEGELGRSTAATTTPYPRTKMTIKRRTLSPSSAGDGKRFKTSRTSLPAALSQESETEPSQIVQEHQFTPLKAVLQERIRRISALRNAAVLGQGDQQIVGFNIPEDADEDMLVLDTMAQLPSPTRTQASPDDGTCSDKLKTPGDSQAHVRATWNVERQSFQDAIIALKEEADEATSHLKILAIELGAIGFGEENATPTAVLESIRESFAQTREFLEVELPGSLPDAFSNQDLLEILISNVKEFANRLRIADIELRDEGALISNLGNQVDGLIGRLADKEIDKARLEDQWRTLDQDNEDKAREIDSLQEELDATKHDRYEFSKERDAQMARAVELEAEKADFEKNIERLSTSLQEYRNEEAKLTNTINNMEDEHRNTIAAMNKEREETVRDLDGQLDSESAKRAEAERAADGRQVIIKELTARVETTEAERDTLREELERTQRKSAAELEAKEDALADLESRNVEVEDHEERVERLEEQLLELNSELATLRELNSQERKQREAAERDLDARNAEVEVLDNKLRENGQQANELRQKLFEVQTTNEQNVEEMQEAMSERDLQFQSDMADAVQRREASDEVAHERAATIVDLEQQLEAIEQQMQAQLAERDAIILQLGNEQTQKDAEMQDLREELRSTRKAYDEEAQEYRDQIKELNGSVAALERTLSDREEGIDNLQQQIIETANDRTLKVEERNSRIAELENGLADAQAQVDVLEKEKGSLERRVEHEATYLLQFQNEKDDEIENLKGTIRDKQAKILNVEEKARTADLRWEEVVVARNEQIENQKETLVKLTAENAKVKRVAEDYVLRASDRIAALEAQVNQTKAVMDQQSDLQHSDGLEMLKELDALHIPTGIVKDAKIRKKRKVDSGIGVNSDELGEEMIEA